jgi:hypothetical protein
MAMLVKFKIS